MMNLFLVFGNSSGGNMKRKIVFLVLLFILIGSFNIVNAANSKSLKMEYQDNIYYTSRGNGNYISNILSFYWIDDEVVYCVEPGVLISDYNYVGELGLDNLPYDKATKEKIELIAYYGYEYPNHQTIKYKMATQALIWESINNSIIEFWTERYGYGDFIDISYEKEEIMKLVNKNNLRPDFKIKKITGTLNEEIVLTDTNQVLEDFLIISDDTFSITKEGNKLILIPKKQGLGEIILKRKTYDNKSSILFTSVNGTSQKLASLRPNYDTLTLKIPYDIKASKISLEKIDYDTKENKPSGGASLKGAIYGIYDVNNNLVSKLVTDENGKAVSPDLAFGHYYLKELKPSMGYQLDPNIYEVDLNEKVLIQKVQVYEKVIKKKLIILKVLENFEDKLIGEANITFNIYEKTSNKLYQSVTTDLKGALEVELPYGVYIVKQQNTTQGYELVDDFEIEINEESPDLIEMTIENKLKRYNLKVIKTDLETGEKILKSGIKFRLKNLLTNEYLINPINKTDIFETNEFGEVLFPFKLAGTFSLEEVDQEIDGYLWNQEKIIFSTLNKKLNSHQVTFLDDLITINFCNQKVLGALKIVKLGEKMVVENNTYSYQKIPLPNVKFNLYASLTDELIQTIETNEDGLAFVDNLELGSYYLKEIKSSGNHLIDTSIYSFNLEYKDQYTEKVIYVLELENHLPKGNLEIFKVAKQTNEPLQGALLAIYKENLLEDELIYEGYTNADGKIILNDLELGNYYVLEKESPVNYQLETKKISFVLTADKEIISLKVENKPIEIKVPNTSLNENYFKNILAFLFLITGLFIIGKAKSINN